MKLSNLKEAVNRFINKHKNGKSLKASKIKKVLDKLEIAQAKYAKEAAAKGSAKTKVKLELKQKVIKAQIKKARALLKDLE